MPHDIQKKNKKLIRMENYHFESVKSCDKGINITCLVL